MIRVAVVDYGYSGRNLARAVVPGHLHAQLADMNQNLALTQRHGLVLIEDAAQGHGADYKERRVGSLRDFGCFSFYLGTNLGAPGEGGLAVTDDNASDRTLRDAETSRNRACVSRPQQPEGWHPGHHPPSQAAPIRATGHRSWRHG